MTINVNTATRKVIKSSHEMGYNTLGAASAAGSSITSDVSEALSTGATSPNFGGVEQGQNSDVGKIGNILNGSYNTNALGADNKEKGPNVPPVNPENEPSMMEKFGGAVRKAINGLGNMLGIKKPEETEGLPTQMANATQQQNGAQLPQEDSAAIQAKNGVGNDNVVANAGEAGNQEAGTGSGENPEEKLGQIADVAGALGSNAPTETKELAAKMKEEALKEKEKFVG